MRNIIGSPMNPEDLFDQEVVLRKIWRHLKDQHLVLLAPRKFGKSSVLLHLEKFPGKGWSTVFLDVSYMKTPEEFIGHLLGALIEKHDWILKSWHALRKVPDRFRKLLENLDIGFNAAGTGANISIALRETEEQSWQDIAATFLRALDEQKGKKKLLILIDEIGKMIEFMSQQNEREDAKALMNWFKSIRAGKPKNLANVRFVVSSSIGVDRVVKKLGVPDAMEDFFPIYIDALPNNKAVELFRLLAETYALSAEEAVWERAVELLGGGVPEFIHMFFSELRDIEQPITVHRLESVYEEKMLGTRWRRSFMEYIDRFDRYGPDVRNVMIDILVNVAREGKATRRYLQKVYNERRGEKSDPLEFQELLADLEADFYLASGKEGYFFMVKMLEDWILKFYGG